MDETRKQLDEAIDISSFIFNDDLDKYVNLNVSNYLDTLSDAQCIYDLSIELIEAHKLLKDE